MDEFRPKLIVTRSGKVIADPNGPQTPKMQMRNRLTILTAKLLELSEIVESLEREEKHD
jgi:hypothetical protein